MKWDAPLSQITEEFEILDDKVVGFDDCEEPIDFFRKFWNDDIMDFILEQTNSYSPETNVNLNELYAVFGVLLASGVVSQSRRRDYWSSNTLKKNIAISSSIGQRRYESIFSKLHFCPAGAFPSNDKYMKVRLLVAKLNRLFLLHCPRGNCFSIDESMIPYFGRHGCKQFIRGKPVRFGYKIWMLATSSGYCVQLQPYPGLAEKATESYDFKSSGNVVYFFSEIIKNHFPDLQLSISMDNYFTSFKVLQAIQNDLGILGTGTMRRNRIPSYPFDDKEIAKERGSIDKRYSEESGVHLVAWQDNKCVVIASTLCGAEPVTNASRYSRTEKRRVVDVPRPAVVKHYNKTMGGVDALDQNLAGCWTSLRGKKWYFPISIYLLDVCCVNAWMIYKRVIHRLVDYNTFRTMVAESYLSKNCKSKPTFVSREVTRFDGQGHLVEYSNQELRCKVCNKNAKFRCIKCNVNLHPKFCFLQFHTK